MPGPRSNVSTSSEWLDSRDPATRSSRPVRFSDNEGLLNVGDQRVLHVIGGGKRDYEGSSAFCRALHFLLATCLSLLVIGSSVALFMMLGASAHSGRAVGPGTLFAPKPSGRPRADLPEPINRAPWAKPRPEPRPTPFTLGKDQRPHDHHQTLSRFSDYYVRRSEQHFTSDNLPALYPARGCLLNYLPACPQDENESYGSYVRHQRQLRPPSPPPSH